MDLFCFVCFSKGYASTLVTAGGLTKLLMQTSARVKTKSCSFSNNEASNLVLGLFTCSIVCYDVGFLWFMFLVAEKIFLSINITCHSFIYFHLDALIRIHTH